MLRWVLVIFFFFLPAFADAVCTQSGTVGTTSIQVVPAQDLRTRSYMLIQNSGAAVNLWVSIGSNNHATTNDMVLKPGGSWLLIVFGQTTVPSGDVSVISTGVGTTYAFCDY